MGSTRCSYNSRGGERACGSDPRYHTTTQCLHDTALIHALHSPVVHLLRHTTEKLEKSVTPWWLPWQRSQKQDFAGRANYHIFFARGTCSFRHARGRMGLEKVNEGEGEMDR